MRRRIAYMVDDVTHIVHPNYANQVEGESEMDFLRRLARSVVPEGAENVRAVAEDDIPRDRADRHAMPGVPL